VLLPRERTAWAFGVAVAALLVHVSLWIFDAVLGLIFGPVLLWIANDPDRAAGIAVAVFFGGGVMCWWIKAMYKATAGR
jgi:hypothetical protein